MEDFNFSLKITAFISIILVVNLAKLLFPSITQYDEAFSTIILAGVLSQINFLSLIPSPTRNIFLSLLFFYLYTFSQNYCNGLFAKIGVCLMLYHIIDLLLTIFKMKTMFKLSRSCPLVESFQSTNQERFLFFLTFIFSTDVFIKLLLTFPHENSSLVVLTLCLVIAAYFGKSQLKINVGIKPDVHENNRKYLKRTISISSDTASKTDNFDDSLDRQKELEIIQKLSRNELKTRNLEYMFPSNLTRAVMLRRKDLQQRISNPLVFDRIPYENYDYKSIFGQCCEEVIGYVPIPLGKAGPLLIDGRYHYIPMSTTEGCLVASVNRGSRVISMSGGTRTAVYRDGMTRAPVVQFPTINKVVECIAWLQSKEGFQEIKTVFDSTSGHANLKSIYTCPVGRYLHIRFSSGTGDAMGMNIVSKATELSLTTIQKFFPQMKVISLSGNMCTDKKPASINYILGRGKSVLVEAEISAENLAKMLNTSPHRLAHLSVIKNYIGSSFAGGSGMSAFNAHSANIVAAIFAATGQDLAQVVNSSACAVLFEVDESETREPHLILQVTMPCLEVATIGGGTRLSTQKACLELMDLDVEQPTEHLARIIASTVMAGELSLMASLVNQDLVSAHLKLNRSKMNSFKNSSRNRQSSTSYSKPDLKHPIM